jgi:uncharacterized membrane protein YdjX (TVP38/TMEM64 family)
MGREQEALLKNRIINFSILFVLAVAGVVFTALSSTHFSLPLFVRFRVWITAGLYVLVTAATILGLIFYLKNKQVAYKLTLTVFVLLDFILILFYCLLASGFFSIVNDAETFQAYLASAGGWMDVLFIVLQFLQVVILPIPSFVTLVAGTALFGPVRCFLYSYFAIVLGSIVAFFIGRFLGYRTVSWIVGKETLDKWLQKVKGKDSFLLTAMFILPFFPDDVLCFVAGLSTMTTPYFIGMILIARAFSAATTCFSVGFIPFNTWWGIMIWAVIILIVLAAFIFFCKYQDKIHEWLAKKGKKGKKGRK